MTARDLIAILQVEPDAEVFVTFEGDINPLEAADVSRGQAQLEELIPAGDGRDEPYQVWYMEKVGVTSKKIVRRAPAVILGPI